jgi:hypothetical protein
MVPFRGQSDLFEVNVTSIKVKEEEGHEQTWRADFVTWSEENPQASAGAHNAGQAAGDHL